MTGWSLEEAAGRPMAEVFRILDAASSQTIAEPDGDGCWAKPNHAPAAQLHPHPARRT